MIRALATPDPNDDFAALMLAIQTVGKTDFPARAQAIADQIQSRRPHAVGLQEVSEINIDLRSLGVDAVVNQDFLALLQGHILRVFHLTVCIEPLDLESLAEAIDAPALAI